MQKRKIDGYFINTYYDDNGVDFMLACWILNGRFYQHFYDAKNDVLHKTRRISGAEYQRQYEYHYNI